MMDLAATVRQFIRRYELFRPDEAVVVGVSGGPDSLCLLHLLHALAGEMALRLHVAHLNHGLRGAEADADAEFVAGFAAGLGLPCTIGRADVQALSASAGLSLEEAARQARYRFLAEVARAAGASTIAVGHNADDQAETVLMHFLRGSGLSGLRGMLPKTPLGEYRLADAEQRQDGGSYCIVRPLLAIPRRDIALYCAEHGLQPRFDLSNEDTTFFRNRLRHELLPILERYNPAIREILTHTAAVLAGDHQIVRAAIEEAWSRLARVAPASEGGEVYFDLAGWRALPLGLQRGLLREAIHRLRASLRNINWVHVERALWLCREGTTGQKATLAAGLEVEIGYQALRIGPEGAPPAAADWSAPGLAPRPPQVLGAGGTEAAGDWSAPGLAPRPPQVWGAGGAGAPFLASAPGLAPRSPQVWGAGGTEAAGDWSAPGLAPRSPQVWGAGGAGAAAPFLAGPRRLAVPGRTDLGEGWRAEIAAAGRSALPADLTTADPWTAFLDARAVGAELTLRPRLPGDRFQPQGMAGHGMKLNEFMINVKLPKALRERWPLLIGAGGIAWVCGLRVAAWAAVTAHTEAVWIVKLVRGEGEEA